MSCLGKGEAGLEAPLSLFQGAFVSSQRVRQLGRGM